MNEYYSRWLKNCRPKNIDIVMGIDEHDIKQRNNTKDYEARVVCHRIEVRKIILRLKKFVLSRMILRRSS